MKTIDTLAAMAANLPASACTPMRAILSDLAGFWDQADIDQVSLTHLFDSPVFVIEAVEELANVRSFDEIDGERVSILTRASEAFDIADWTEDGAFAVLGTIETANGGPQFYIPKAIADLAPTVAESIRLKARAGDHHAQEEGEEA